MRQRSKNLRNLFFPFLKHELLGNLWTMPGQIMNEEVTKLLGGKKSLSIINVVYNSFCAIHNKIMKLVAYSQLHY